MSSESSDAFNSKTTLGNVSLGQPLKIDNTKPSYAEPPDASGKEAQTLEELRKKHAPNADKKTIASALKGLLDINNILQLVDPTGSSSAMPNMVSGLSKVNSTLNSAAPSTKKTVLQNSLYGALCQLSRKYTFDRVIIVFDNALAKDGILDIDSNQRSVVSTAITYLIQNANDNGPNNIKIPVTFEKVTSISNTAPSPITNLVPDLYTQVYYTMDADPYMGYIKWLSNDSTTTVYTERTIGDYYYETADDEIYDTSVQELVIDLDPYCDPNYLTPITGLPVTLTGKILNDFLSTQTTNIEDNNSEKNLGKGSSSNLMDNLTSLLGYTGGIVSSLQTTQLPDSVLNQSSINSSLNGYSKNIATLKSMKANALTAFKPLSAAASLFSDATSLNNIVGNLQSKGLSIVSGNTVRSLVDNIKSYT
jgi:hypothetical protein